MPSNVARTVPRLSAVSEISALLDSPEVSALVAELDGLRWTGRQRYVKKGGPLRERYSDPEATWGHRSAVSTRSGGSFYGWKIHAAVCARTDLPLAWRIETAKATELSALESLLDAVHDRGFRPETVIGDTGYDFGPGHEAVIEHGAVPGFPRRNFAGEGDWTEAPE